MSQEIERSIEEIEVMSQVAKMPNYQVRAGILYYNTELTRRLSKENRESAEMRLRVYLAEQEKRSKHGSRL